MALATIAAIHLCASFGIFPVNHVLGPSFNLASFQFRDLGTKHSLIWDGGGELGLKFDADGIEIRLPVSVQTIDLRLGTFASDVTITAIDVSGNTVATDTVSAPNGHFDHRIHGSNIALVKLSEGSNEANLISICITIPTLSGQQ